ncbi:zinc finger FYVE domain-containing protein 16 isoform X2 [Rhinatrema bivittatum]|uniref:zinc finger FYVE domain-containing protein 16 isoform X2 n=1 Tax=Rhinatrema bivittatum TaxID=194408 RepID=UPI001128A8D8|nr:zinc finger FYVE domain-containing protein 16 isoform X2 [Rhinatrema bivittatum]
MDSYFKAAVCDLDKLLDDFEQNTDELDCSRTIVSLCSTAHHHFPSALHHLQAEIPAPTLQHGISESTTPEPPLKLGQTTANTINFAELTPSALYERNVTGLDLLSTVDSSASDETQPSSLGRCSVPVCDLISDTGSLILTTASKDDQELQPEDFQSHKDFVLGFDLSSVPATICLSSKEDGGSLGPVEQKIGGAFLPETECFTTGELSLQDLETASPINTELSELYFNQSRVEFTKGDQEENINIIGATSGFISSGNLNTTNLKGEEINIELSHKFLMKENANSSISKEGNVEGRDVKAESNDGGSSSTGSMPSALPKGHSLYEAHINLRLEECESPDVLLHEECSVTLEKEQFVDKIVCSSNGKNTNEISEDASLNSCLPAEEDQTSLSCLPLAVSICGSLVVTDDKECSVLQQGKGRVVSDTVTVPEAASNTGIPERVSCEQTDSAVQGEQQYLGKAYQTFVEKGKVDEVDRKEIWGKIVTEDERHKVIPSFPVVGKSESNFTSVDIHQCDSYKENVSTAEGTIDQALLTADEDILKCDMLISDAELDAFLNEQTFQYSNSKPCIEDFSMSDANQMSLMNMDDGDDLLTDVHTKFNTGARCTTVSDDPRTFGLMNNECKSDSLSTSQTGKNTPCFNPIMETSEAQAPNVNSQAINLGGARPKLLFDLPPRTVSERELSTSLIQNLVETRNEQQKVNFGTPGAAPTGSKTSSDLSSSCNYSGMETSLETEGESALASTEKQESAADEESTQEGTVLGHKQPSWVPDAEAPNCMNCQVRFTFTKRRHHCRACGKVFCTACCNRKCKLQYMEKEARVCVVCYDSINKVTCPKEQKRVWFADGILPNGEVADTTKLSTGIKRSSQDVSPVSPVIPESPMVASLVDDDPCTADVWPKEDTNSLVAEAEQLLSPVPAISSDAALPVICSSADKMRCNIAKYVSKEISLLPEEEDQLPPLLVAVGEDPIVEKHPSHKQLMMLLEEGGPNPLTFILNANLLVNIKLTSYSSEKCWYFSTNGLHGLGQAEIIILLQCLPHEDSLPKDIFKLFLSIYKDALKGKYIGNLENITFTESFLNSKDHGGFLFIAPTFQDLGELPLPSSPFLCGILIQKLEVPWAKVFPVRLMLRLGAEYGVYPSPVMSIRHRKPLFGEIGHTIMNLLADLRNFQYTLPNVDGLLIHMEMGKSCIKIPLRRYSEVLKVINSCNEHVISIGASFSVEADSHLVCVQNDEGQYQTQANSATDEPRKVTGASFVVFNGALKASSGFLAKSSIVEDGLMVQITPETMEALRQALREKRDFCIACGKLDAGDLREDVNICWVETEDKVNKGVISPIDGQSMEGIPSEKIFQEADFETDDKLVKCTDVFYLLRGHDSASTATHYQFAKEIGTACSAALCPHLKILKENGMSKIGLRISMDIDMVEYRAGSGGQLLPQHYLNELDSALVPVIHGRASDTSTLPLMMELFFFLIENLF